MADIANPTANPIAIPTPRLDFRALAPELYKAQAGLNAQIARSSLGVQLLELVYLRVSQINGCAFCLDMHSKDARAAGEDEQRLYLLSAWREAPCYTPRERAALAWAEAVTLLKDQEVGDAQYHAAREHFDDKALVDLTLAIVAINGWNRLSIAFRTPAGTYQPQHHS